MAGTINTDLPVRESGHESTKLGKQSTRRDELGQTTANPGHSREGSQDASGDEPERSRLNTLAQIRENIEAIDLAKQCATTTPATRTPQGPQPYQLWTPGATYSLQITYGKDEKPNLGSQDTLLYDCFCGLNPNPDKALDPPAYVHLSDREVRRLYLLVCRGYKTLEYLSVTWPHVFDSKGGLWEHREPQGEPFLSWHAYSGPRYLTHDEFKRDDRTEYVVAHSNYILMGSGAWHKMRSSSTQYYLVRCDATIGTGTEGDITWSVAAHKSIEHAQARAEDHTKPQLLGWLKHADSYMYQAYGHRFAITIDPSRIQAS
jgi:hypothetical protein